MCLRRLLFPPVCLTPSFYYGCGCGCGCVRWGPYQTDEQFILTIVQGSRFSCLLVALHKAFRFVEKLLGRNPHMLNPTTRQHVSSSLQRVDQCHISRACTA